jgi:hypothetical protein
MLRSCKEIEGGRLGCVAMTFIRPDVRNPCSKCIASRSRNRPHVQLNAAPQTVATGGPVSPCKLAESCGNMVGNGSTVRRGAHRCGGILRSFPMRTKGHAQSLLAISAGEQLHLKNGPRPPKRWGWAFGPRHEERNKILFGLRATVEKLKDFLPKESCVSPCSAAL